MEFAKLALSLRKFELFYYYYYYYVYIFHINHYSESKHYIPTTLYFQIHKVFLVFINKYTFLYLSVTNDGFFYLMSVSQNKKYLSPHFSIEFQSLKAKNAHCAGIHI